MDRTAGHYLHWLFAVLATGVAFVFSGCDAPQAEFKVNLVYARAHLVEDNSKLSDPEIRAQLDDLADLMSALMGTPDDPHLGAQGLDTFDLVLGNQ